MRKTKKILRCERAYVIAGFCSKCEFPYFKEAISHRKLVQSILPSCDCWDSYLQINDSNEGANSEEII